MYLSRKLGFFIKSTIRKMPESFPLSFRREFVNTNFLKYYRDGVSKRQTSWVSDNHVLDDVWYDQVMQVSAEKQGRCKVCKKNSRIICAQCKVILHDDCFNIFNEHFCLLTVIQEKRAKHWKYWKVKKLFIFCGLFCLPEHLKNIWKQYLKK